MTVFALFVVVGYTRPARAMCSAWIAEKLLVINLINNVNNERVN